jgi:hypothetical protein
MKSNNKPHVTNVNFSTMYSPLRHHTKRLILGNYVKPFLLSIGLFVVGSFLLLFSLSKSTSFSERVSGYRRSNGTYVRGYSRRPSGGVSHDMPYEILGAVSVLLAVTGVAIGGMTCKDYQDTSDWDLLPAIDFSPNLPPCPRSIQLIDIPSNLSKARKAWSCVECELIIHPGNTYFKVHDRYFSLKREQVTSTKYGIQFERMCLNCKKKLQEWSNSEMARKPQYEKEMQLYQEAGLRENKKEEEIKHRLYVKVFGYKYEDTKKIELT